MPLDVLADMGIPSHASGHGQSSSDYISGRRITFRFQHTFEGEELNNKLLAIGEFTSNMFVAILEIIVESGVQKLEVKLPDLTGLDIMLAQTALDSSKEDTAAITGRGRNNQIGPGNSVVSEAAAPTNAVVFKQLACSTQMIGLTENWTNALERVAKRAVPTVFGEVRIVRIRDFSGHGRDPC